ERVEDVRLEQVGIRVERTVVVELGPDVAGKDVEIAGHEGPFAGTVGRPADSRPVDCGCRAAALSLRDGPDVAPSEAWTNGNTVAIITCRRQSWRNVARPTR